MSIPADQLKVHEKLESIFLPSSRKKREKAYGNPGLGTNPSARFVHYTSADAALKIIQNKKIWMRNMNCMTDFREFTHGLTVFNQYLLEKNNENEKALFNALGSNLRNTAEEAFNLFRSWRDAVWLNTYLTCVSEHKEEEDTNGRLSMWRAFGNSNSTRVAIVVKFPWLLDIGNTLHLRFSPVDYPEKAHEDLDMMVQNIRNNRDFLESTDGNLIKNIIFNMIISRVLCVKHRGFHEEEEWRVIYTPSLNTSEKIEESVETINGMPQKIHSIYLDGGKKSLPELNLSNIIDRVIIGPSQYSRVIRDAFIFELNKIKVPNAENLVFYSEIPIRT